MYVYIYAYILIASFTREWFPYIYMYACECMYICIYICSIIHMLMGSICIHIYICMYVYMHMYTYMHIYICCTFSREWVPYVYIYTYVCVYICICIHICIYISVAHSNVNGLPIYTYIHMYVCIHAYIFVASFTREWFPHIFIYTYVCMYIYIYIFVASSKCVWYTTRYGLAMIRRLLKKIGLFCKRAL